MKTVTCILLSIISAAQVVSVLGASPFANTICDTVQNGKCQSFKESSGLKCVCNSYKPGSPTTYCSQTGPDGRYELCVQGSEAEQKCADFCGSNGVFVCENGFCHSN